MVAERNPPPPRNGREPAPAPMERWVCNGWDERRGRVCGQVLMDLAVRHGRIRIRCHKCGTWHTREAA